MLTSPELSQWMTPGERKRLAPHAVWTRLLFSRRTTDERGRSVELFRHLAPSTWVAEALGEVMVESFPIVGSDGTAKLVPHFVDCGVYCVGETYGILSRAAYRRVVNVSSGGGLAVVLFA